ncbi:4a-hydroxytetrahydrobiopterin dehydratase [Halococcus saccharolyticus]|uniref:Putative pterin-4-alpha-carbinolamine dehydratase n=1 Tax=Halococcus saccharolyticus DSM 5350 TaxID=1227455 RepID=M0ME76_9EURY|nr:4a-hydroxytetrahydrobiopterin dehydratase [Halococcus saccharolyticus]EMA44026.1 pterin-4-alpha-carbinolamine dehydratase [Halococcus saccharolyticus DSM 5350]
MAEILSDDEISENAPAEWQQDGDEIVRVYEFEEYLDGVAFVTEVAEIADEEFHHPEIQVRFDEVEVRLTSHEAGGVTDQDIEMAGRFDDVR